MEHELERMSKKSEKYLMLNQFCLFSQVKLGFGTRCHFRFELPLSN